MRLARNVYRNIWPRCIRRGQEHAAPPRQARMFTVVAAFLALGLPHASAAQTVFLRVTNADTGKPVFGALAELVDSTDSVVDAGLTDEMGRLSLTGTAGEFRVQVEMLGMASVVTDAILLGPSGSLAVSVYLDPTALELEGIVVETEAGSCRLLADEALLLTRMWEEVRKSLKSAVLTRDQKVFEYRVLRFERDLSPTTLAVRNEQRARDRLYVAEPFTSRPIDDLLENGFVQSLDGRDNYFAPDAEGLLSEAFLAANCYRFEQGRDDAEGLVGFSFEPRGELARTRTIAGTLWIEPATYELRRLDFRYLNIDPRIASDQIGGQVGFLRLPNGSVVVSDWSIRMPSVAMTSGIDVPPQPVLAGIREVGGAVTQVRRPGGEAVMRSDLAIVTGIVLDSLLGSPVGGATVFVEGTDRRVASDRHGRFRIDDLSDGTYAFRVEHPSLMGLRFAGDRLLASVARGRTVALRFAMPTVLDILVAACRDQESATEGPTRAVIGVVTEESTGLPLEGAMVTLSWRGGWRILRSDAVNTANLTQTTGSLVVSTDSNGAYQACSVPGDRRVTVSTDYGTHRSLSQELAASPRDTSNVVPFSIPVEGLSSIFGRVLSMPGGEPVQIATVSIDGLQHEVLTDSAGTFRISAIPAGRYAIRVEGLGITAAVDSVLVPPGQHIEVELVVGGQVIQLEGLEVTVRSRELTEQRPVGRTSNLITRAEIAELEDRSLRILDVIQRRIGPRLQIFSAPSRQGMSVDLCIRPTRRNLSISDLRQFSGDCRPVMVIMDGMVLWAPPASSAAGTSARMSPPPGTFREILGIRPDEVQRIEFLTSVDAQFRYGDQGRYGALVIETRRGGGRGW